MCPYPRGRRRCRDGCLVFGRRKLIGREAATRQRSLPRKRTTFGQSQAPYLTSGSRRFREKKRKERTTSPLAALTSPEVCRGIAQNRAHPTGRLPRRIFGGVDWRRGWDSNPRYGYPYNGFRVLRISHAGMCRLVAKRVLWFGISPTTILSFDARYRAVLCGSFANPFANSRHKPMSAYPAIADFHEGPITRPLLTQSGHQLSPANVDQETRSNVLCTLRSAVAGDERVERPATMTGRLRLRIGLRRSPVERGRWRRERSAIIMYVTNKPAYTLESWSNGRNIYAYW